MLSVVVVVADESSGLAAFLDSLRRDIGIDVSRRLCFADQNVSAQPDFLVGRVLIPDAVEAFPDVRKGDIERGKAKTDVIGGAEIGDHVPVRQRAADLQPLGVRDVRRRRPLDPTEIRWGHESRRESVRRPPAGVLRRP